MRNPLRKRLLRELKGDLAKYGVIFVFIAATFEKYNIEDGHFALSGEPDKEFWKRLSEKTGAALYPLWYREAETEEGHTLRCTGRGRR